MTILSPQPTALILLDFINDIVDPKGKLAGKGYAKYDAEFHALDTACDLLARARAKNTLIIHVRVGFSPDYKELPESSPLFGGAKKFDALKLDTWGTEFHSSVAPHKNEAVITKHRVSAFYDTPLSLLLKTNNIDTVIIAGCATDMAVQATARDAHDRDFHCIVAGDSCIAAGRDDHEQTLRMLAKIATVQVSADLFGL